MEVVSLFAGCGGLDLGFRRAGFKVKWANEFDAAIHATYLYNHPHVILNTSDVRNLDVSEIPDSDGIIGGPPCQSWSLGGKSLGLNDERGQLVYDYIRIVKEKRPKFFIMENVAGMVSPRHIDVFQSFLNLFRDIGYKVKFELINAADFRIPQDRLRVFVVGIRNDIDCEYIFPTASLHGSVTLRQAIGDLQATLPRPYNNKEIVVQSGETIPNHDYYTGAYDQKFMARNRVRAWNEKSYTIQAQAKNEPLHPQAPKMRYISGNEREFVKGHESEYRRLSVRECARIQTFPDSFYFIYTDIRDGYKMVGNAVPPRLAFALAVSIKKCLSQLSNEASCQQVLIGYVKSMKDLELVRYHKVYYIRAGYRAGAMQYGQVEKPIKWLLLHNKKRKWLFELTGERALQCNKIFLQNLGFTPHGNDYWYFTIQEETGVSDTMMKLQDGLELTTTPKILQYYQTFVL